MAETQNNYVVDYLQGDFLRAIEADLEAVLIFHERREGGFHSIAREVFCYIEYLGTLRYGNPSTTTNAVCFIENYLGERYKKFGRTIFEIWRHGTVHQFGPRSLKHSTAPYKLSWRTTKLSEQSYRQNHLCCTKDEIDSDLYRITLNLFELVGDLKKAVRAFVDDMKSNPELMEKVRGRYEKMSNPVPVNKLNIKDQEVKNDIDRQIEEVVRQTEIG